MTTVAKDAREQEMDEVIYENNSIMYQGNRYSRGGQIYIENRESSRFPGTITAVNSSEVRASNNNIIFADDFFRLP